MKDIEWLKKEIGTEMIQLEPNRKDRWSDVKYQTLRSIAQKINQLDKTETLSQEWIDDHTYHEEEYDFYYMDPDEVKEVLVPEITEEPETVADVVITFLKSYKRLKEVMSMEVEDLEE